MGRECREDSCFKMQEVSIKLSGACVCVRLCVCVLYHAEASSAKILCTILYEVASRA